MRCQALVLQHQHNAPPALPADWSWERGVELVVIRADREHRLPAPGGFDFGITLGSDHSAGGRTPAWVRRELEWLRLADRGALPILGICFGAQALSVALGAAVRRARHPEIGWISVETDRPTIVERGPWFAWHEDVFELPDIAVEIARNPFGPQAFIAGLHVGVQFHPEVTPEVTAMWGARPSSVRWLALAGLDLARLKHQGLHHARQARAASFRLFDAFAAPNIQQLRTVGEAT